jgi:hypothetical protein
MDPVLPPSSAPNNNVYASAPPPNISSQQSAVQQLLNRPGFPGVAVNGVAGVKRPYVGDENTVGNDHTYRAPVSTGGVAPKLEETPSRDVSDVRDSSTASPSGQPNRKKQKRNKPTLSCFECVERKTKACLSVLLPQFSPLESSVCCKCSFLSTPNPPTYGSGCVKPHDELKYNARGMA